MKKGIISLLTFVLVLTGLCFFGADKREVKAATTTQDGFVSVQYTDLTVYRAKNDIKAPTYTDGKIEWIFAGWYRDEDCTKAYTNISASTTSAYAKFVPADVLSVRLQLTAGTEQSSQTTNMRLVSSVDSLQYKYVGFEIYYKGATKPVTVKATKVYERIVASAESGVDYDYSPKVMDVESQYFVTATILNIANKNFGYDDPTTNFYIRPYWRTLDGTTVYGVNRYVNVKNGLDNTNVNIPVKMDAEPSSPTVTVGGTDYDASVAYYDGTYAHMNITVPSRNTVLKSLSTVNVTAGDITGSAIYRNLQSTYNGTSDTSWYDIPNSQGRTEFSIATSADLYGFSKVVTSTNNFSNKKVYLVSDIEANQGYADKANLKWDDTKAADGTTAIEGTSNPWTAIGSTSYAFNGVFDGQMHTISGIYLNGTTSYQGMFSATGTNAKICNFYLKNSFFTLNTGVQLGSVVGNAMGTFNNIYSDAVVVSNGCDQTGGILGATSTTKGVTMTNCWFAGSVTCQAKNSYLGGLIGRVANSSTITNCLNTGNVTHKTSGVTTNGAAGFVGWVDKTSVSTTKVDINHSVNAGTITVAGGKYYGLFVGKGDGTVNATNSHSLNQTDYVFVYEKTNEEYSTCGRYALSNVAGLNSLTQAKIGKLFTEDAAKGYWSITNDGFPVLSTFEKDSGVVSQVVDTSWYDASKTEFTLMDSGDLYGLALLSQTNKFDNVTIKLGADIEVNKGKALPTGWDTSQVANGSDLLWMPIGNNSYPFNGEFDGQMHTISGIYLNSTSARQGMFSATGSNAEIRNFYLKNSYFTATNDKLGSIVGEAKGTFEAIYSDAIVASYSGCDQVGGLIGATPTDGGVIMNDCWFAGSATINEAASYLGGLIGAVQSSSTIKNCLNTATLEHKGNVGTAGMGGFVGHASAVVDITYSLNTGDVIRAYSRSQYYGLFVGKADKTPDITYSHSVLYKNEHNTVNSKQLVGAATNEGSSPGTCHRFDVSQLAGLNALTTTYTNAKQLFIAEEAQGHWSITKSDFPVLTIFEQGSGVVSQAVDTSWYDASKTEFTLMDSGDLYGLALLSQTNKFDNSTIKLGADIEVNKGKALTTGWDTSQVANGRDFLWLPIGNTSYPFNGEFDGQMHTISGIYLNATSARNGMFSVTGSNAEIRNFYLKNSYITSTVDKLGSIVGEAKGTFEKVYSDAIVAGYCNQVGGMLGYISGTVTMNDCWFAGSATINSGASYLGGLVAYAASDVTMTNCLNTGEVYHKTSVGTAGAGGFVGYTTSPVTISSSVNHGNVKYTKGSFIGLFVGGGTGTVTLTDSHSINHASKYLVNGSDSGYSTCTKQNASDVAGVKALSTDKVKELFLSDTAKGHWSITKDTLPVLTVFEKGSGVVAQAVDTSWYDTSKTEFTLMDSGDLYGLALLSKTNTFAGKDFKLGADITVNKDIENPDFEWISICPSSSCTFQGDFDGQMHTISGLYQNAANQLQGLFGDVLGGEITNLIIENSYFNYSGTKTDAFIGALAGRATGSIKNVYVNATVESSAKRTAGLVGATTTSGSGISLTLVDCWNAGTISSKGQATAGLIGYVDKSVTMKNCLNTGTISTSYAESEKYIGGLIGHINTSSSTIKLYNCLNTGEVNYTGGSASQYGMLIGSLRSNTSFSAVYTVKQENMPAYHQLVTAEDESTSNVAYSREDITFDFESIRGTNAFINISPLFAGDGVDQWVCVKGNAPVLATFAEYAGFTAIQAVDLSATSEELTALASLYDGTQLYQGELHNHAKTQGRGQVPGIPGDDGKVDLATWKTQMNTYGLDFAASLDHNQSDHILLEEWDPSKFVYGTELGANIKDDNGTVIGDIHFDMIFKTQEQLDDFIDTYSKYFTKMQVLSKTYFYGGSMSKAEFKTLIATVISEGGFVNLPHPLQNDDYPSDKLESFYLELKEEVLSQRIYGIQTIYLDTKHQVSRDNYALWMKMLANGQRVYATAGSDNHEGLTPYTLTSIYAPILKDHTACTTKAAKMSCSSTECNKGNMIPSLQQGKFVAGSVGIKMSVGETAMGGTCDFTGQRVVVDVDKIHNASYDATHKYRLDVMNEDGIVYYKYLTFTKDENGDVLGDDFAFNADAESQFYRVEITDVTTGYRIAIGNPIWNSK